MTLSPKTSKLMGLVARFFKRDEVGVVPAIPAAGIAPSKVPDGYTSVVYVHGIGSQRRYEEVSALIDSLDRYSHESHRGGDTKGKLSVIRARVEPFRGGSDQETIGFINAQFSSGSTGRKAVRFYEHYWAPIMAEVRSPWSVIRWLFRQSLRPFATVRSPWRERQRLRRGTLVSLFDHGRALPLEVERRDCGKMLRLYDDFEGLAAQREFPAGRYSDFLEFIRQKQKGHPDRMKRHLALASIWRRTYMFEEARNAFVLGTLALSMVLFAGGALIGTFKALQYLVAQFAQPFAGIIPLVADWQTAAVVTASAAGLLGLGKAVTDYLGDVESWATYEETDTKHAARQKVLHRGIDLLGHVLDDPNCSRVVIIAHSLGTSIAYETILALTRLNRAFDSKNAMSARYDLNKIDQLITLGSPIDKIEYFFESYASRSHRFKRVVEELRGDIGSSPFSNEGLPRIHWLNVWDEGDPISGPLHSPTGTELFLQRVDNYRVAGLGFPAPAASHVGYFGTRQVVGMIWDAIFVRVRPFGSLTAQGKVSQEDFDRLLLGPGSEKDGRRGWTIAVLAIPWLSAMGALLYGIAGVATALPALVLAGLLTTLVALGYAVSRASGLTDPL